MVWFYYGRWVTLDLWLCRDLWKHASSPQVYRATPNKQLLLYKPHFSTSFLILNDCCRKWLGYLQCIQLWHYVQRWKLIGLNDYLGKKMIQTRRLYPIINGRTLDRPFPNSFFTLRWHAFTTFRNPLHIYCTLQVTLDTIPLIVDYFNFESRTSIAWKLWTVQQLVTRASIIYSPLFCVKQTCALHTNLVVHSNKSFE